MAGRYERIGRQHRAAHPRAFAHQPVERVDIHVGVEPGDVVEQIDHRHVDDRPLLLQHFDAHRLARFHVQHLGQLLARSPSPRAAAATNSPVRDLQPQQRGIVRQAHDADAPRTVAATAAAPQRSAAARHRYTPGSLASSLTASIDTGSTVASDRSNRCTS